MSYVVAFLVGGALCALSQLVVDTAKVNPAYVMVASVSIGALLSGLGLYGPLVKVAEAGATTPLLGFGHSLVTGMLEDAAKMGPFGLLTGGFRAASAGIMTAVLVGYLMAVVFDPKG